MKKKKPFKSIRMKLFGTLTIVVVIIVFFLIFINSIVLESYYLYSKVNTLLSVYTRVNNYYISDTDSSAIEVELEKIAINNNFDIIIKTDEDISIYSSNKNFLDTLGKINSLEKDTNSKNMIYQKENIQIKTVQDNKTSSKIVLLTGQLNNGYKLYIRMSVASIQDSVKISNNLLCLIGFVAILIG